jgi:hypothetical protein
LRHLKRSRVFSTEICTKRKTLAASDRIRGTTPIDREITFLEEAIMEEFFQVTVQFISVSKHPSDEIARQVRDYLYSGEHMPDTGSCCDIDLAPFEAFVRDVRFA